MNDEIRLIDANEAIKAVEKVFNFCFGRFFGCNKPVRIALINLIKQEINELPTIDTETARRGEWVYNDDDEPVCSVCGNLDALSREDYDYRGGKIRDNQSDYCPHCGAKMDGDAI